MKKIKLFLSTILKSKLIINSLISVLLLGGSFYLYQTYSSNSSKEFLKIIPKESAFVMSFSPVNFISKMDIKDLLETKLGKKSEKFLKKSDIDMLEDLFEDPLISGIDYLSEILVFHSYEDVEEHYFCVSAGVKDAEKFGEFLEDISKEAGDKIKIKEEDDFDYFVEENIGIVWDDDKFILIAGTTDEDDLEDHMEKLMTLKKDERITSNESFNSFYEKRQDLSIWISTELIDEFEDEIEDNFRYELRDIERQLGMSSEDIIRMYDDNIITFYINFDNGEIVCSSEFIPNSELKELNTEYNLWDGDFNEKLLKYIPDNNIALLSQKINVDGFYELIKKYIDSDDIYEFESKMEDEIGLDMEDLLNTFAGSFIANINGFGEVNTTYSDYVEYYNEYKDYEYNYYTEQYEYEGGWDYKYTTIDTTMNLPLFSVVFDMKDNKFAEKIIAITNENGELRRSFGYHTFNAEGMDMFIDFDKTTFIVTNDQDAINQFEDNGYNKYLSSSDNIVDNISYAYLNLDYDNYSDIIEESFGDRIPSDAEMMMDIWDDLFEKVEFKQSIDAATGIFSAEFKMSFKDKEQNILQSVYELIEENSREFFNIIN